MGIEIGAGTTEAAVKPGTYRYRLSDMRASSARLGPCEVCHDHVTDVYRQSEEQAYDDDGWIAWSCYECVDLFGHKDCLIGARRSPRLEAA